MKKIRLSITLILVFALLVVTVGCGKQAKQSTTTTTTRLSGTIKIGSAISQTGPYAPGTAGHRTAIDMATEDINKSGILDDAKIEVYKEDSVNTAATAINAFQKLISTDKVIAIIGPSAGEQALASDSVAQKAGVMVLNVSSLRDISVIGDYVFTTVPIIPDMVPAATEQVVKTRNIKTVAMLTQKDFPTSMQCRDQRLKTFSKLGVNVVLDELGLTTDTDFTSIISKIMNLNPDMVAMDGTTPHDPLFLNQLRSAGYKGTVFAGVGTNPASVWKANPASFEGVINLTGYLAGIPTASAKVQEFEKRFKERNNNFALDQYSAGIYDNLWMLAYAIKKAGTTTDVEAIRDAYATIEYEGIQGKLKFDKDRIQAHSPAVFVIKNSTALPFTN